MADALHRQRPDRPVVVEVRRSEGELPPPGCYSLTVPSSVEGQIRVVWRALEPSRVCTAPSPSVAKSATMARLADLLGW